MLNDTLLSGLSNLFALFGAKRGLDVDRSEQVLGDYLVRHFGLRDTSAYTGLYKDLRMFYDMDMAGNTDQIIERICTGFKGRITHEELVLTMLRLLEFCHIEPDKFDGHDPIFKQLAVRLEVDEKQYGDFLDYIEGRESDAVHHQRLAGYEGTLKTLWIPGSSTLVFSYDGSDEVLLNDMPLLRDAFQIWPKSGVLKNRKGAPVYYSTVFRPYTEASSEPLSFCGRDVNFRFPGSDNGLHDLSFDLHGGELVAIMGGSGAGKTTLQSLLNGSLLPDSGAITINGHSIQEPQARQLIGFVPQSDLLVEELSVYQNLYFTACLCFDGLSEEELDHRVMKILVDLGLERSKDLVVGNALNKTISGGERKRLNIALELIREPSILLLDEPTSGLSSADTENVMGLLKGQTDKGKLVIVVIHQPSSDVYKIFDRLWLVDKGGYPVFDGNPIDAVTYFKTLANYADSQTSSCPSCGNINPEIVLNIIEEKSLDSTGRPTSERKTSPQQWHEAYLSSRPEFCEPARSEIPFSGQKKPGVLRQWGIFFKRNVLSRISNRQYLLITLLEAPVLAAICAAITHYAPLSGYTVMDNNAFTTYMFMAVIVAVFLGMSGSAEELIHDRHLLRREKYLSLNFRSYIWSKIAYSAIISLIQTTLFLIAGDLLMGLRGLFPVWFAVLFTTSLLSNLIGLLLSRFMNSVVSIYITIPLLLIPQILLCGLVVPFSDLNGRSKTDNVPVIGDVIPSRWAFEALAVGTFCYNDYEKPYFDLDLERGEAEFFREGFIYEMESQLETIAKEGPQSEYDGVLRSEILKNNLPRLESVCGLHYDGEYDYSSLSAYLEAAKGVLTKRGNAATLAKDRLVTADIRDFGKEEMVLLKRRCWNLQLENLVCGADSEKLLEVVDGWIVPRTAFIYLTPVSRNGRAPFYSPVKVLGGWRIPTVPFNLCVMLLMCALLAGVLLTEFKNKQ